MSFHDLTQENKILGFIWSVCWFTLWQRLKKIKFTNTNNSYGREILTWLCKLFKILNQNVFIVFVQVEMNGNSVSDGNIILKMYLKCDVRVCTRYIQLRLGPVAGSSKHGNETSGPIIGNKIFEFCITV